MKAIIKITSENYGGFMAHNWTLELSSGKQQKSFFLGQDVKFCSRVLGMEPNYIIGQIGSGNLHEEEVRIKLANFIVEQLELTEDVFNLQSWELSCQ